MFDENKSGPIESFSEMVINKKYFSEAHHELEELRQQMVMVERKEQIEKGISRINKQIRK